MELVLDEDKKPNLDILFDDLVHPNPNINEEACLSLIRHWPNEALERLILSLDDQDLVLRRKFVAALGTFGIIALQPICVKFIASKDRNIRTSCLKVLVKIAANNYFDSISNGLRDVVETALLEDAPEITLTVISLLRQLGMAGLPYLIRVSQDKNLLRAKAAITALGEIDDPSVEICLKVIIEDKSTDVLILDGAVEALNNFNRETLL